jgi:hypothetical protein
MIEFSAGRLLLASSTLNGCEMKILSEDRSAEANAKTIEIVLNCVTLLESVAGEHQLVSTVQQSRRILDHLNDKDRKQTYGEIRDDLMGLRLRLRDDLDSHNFWHLDFQQAEQLRNPTKDWDTVIARFPKVRYNIEESGKCFALERYGAAVFHILQVAEHGVIEVSTLLQVTGDKPGWGNLKRLRELIKDDYTRRTPLAQQHSKLLEDTVPLAVIIKDNWRHKLDHVDNQIIWVDTDFSPLVAGEIISATRAFMRKLAIDL